METKTLKTVDIVNENRSPIASFQLYDLPIVIEDMKHDSTCTKESLNAKILFKSFDNQIVVTLLQKNAEIKSFQSNDSISFYIIEGKMKIFLPKKSITIKQGQLLELHDKIRYRLKSEIDTVFLLRISNYRQKTNEEEIPWCL